jgi:allophanate hydrolase subunit 2
VQSTASRLIDTENHLLSFRDTAQAAEHTITWSYHVRMASPRMTFTLDGEPADRARQLDIYVSTAASRGALMQSALR